MDKYKVAIVIPAFNEDATIFNIVQSVKKYGTVIVVDDYSTDGTGSTALKAGAIVIRHKKNKGYDGALNSGFSKAEKLKCSLVITFDADGQHNAQVLGEFIELIENGAGVVIGIRDKFQRVSEYIFSWASRRKWGISDPLCGMKAYHIDVYNKLKGFDFDRLIGTELCVFGVKSGFKVVQIPIDTIERKDNPRFGNRMTANMKILRALFLLINKY